MPSWSGAGKRRPVSTTTIRPSYSRTVMFLPISPSPPSGRTRRVPLNYLDPLEQSVGLERGVDLRPLLLGGVDQRQEALVDLPATLRLVDHAPHLGADEMGGHEDAAAAAHVEHVGQHVVVARQ